MELGSKFYVMGYFMEGWQFGASSSTSLIVVANLLAMLFCLSITVVPNLYSQEDKVRGTQARGAKLEQELITFPGEAFLL
ncbi:hypothetical protein GIB67_004825 [Kingdonia uniflora]|uniref:Uncharacterized protein n=1 Tax=Kingdonia uniflora TaxID=39325 RepID=A0A7J7LNM7_9MAGN|nr:hypothetical protein GIB67_004825 [Kingdonia uniflora]